VSADVCPRCGEPLPADANFCPNCGAPVSIQAAAERRIVTVVFVDLAGSTQLASRLDPERFREVLAAYHGMVAEEIAWVGGVAEGFIGDAVLGVFGIPVARDDDAVRGSGPRGRSANGPNDSEASSICPSRCRFGSGSTPVRWRSARRPIATS